MSRDRSAELYGRLAGALSGEKPVVASADRRAFVALPADERRRVGLGLAELAASLIRRDPVRCRPAVMAIAALLDSSERRAPADRFEPAPSR